MTALRAGIAIYVVSLIGCDNLLGLHDIVPDGEPVALSINAASKGVAQQPLGPIAVTVRDIQGKDVRDFSGEVNLAFGNNPVGATLLGTLTATATRGIAYFDLVGIDTPGTGYTLIASTEGLPPATSSSIEILAPRFTPVSTGVAGGSIASIAVSPAPIGGTTTAFAGARDGVHKSGDGGASWKRASFGGHAAGHLIADPARPGVVYSWSFRSLKKTTDGGGTWHDLGIEDPSSVALDPRHPSTIYASGYELFRSTDGGTTWTEVASRRCERIAVDAVAADTVYCAVYDPTTDRVVVLKSSNGGVAWSATKGLGSAFYIDMMVATPRGVFVSAGGALYRSVDADASWARVPAASGNAMAYAPAKPDRIYLASGSSIRVSDDGGISFGAPVNAGEFIQDLAVDPMNVDVVYAAGSRGVLVSTSGGASWSPSSKGIDAHVITSVAMAPGAPGILLTATERGTLRTIDGGTSWTAVSQISATVHFDPAMSTRVYQCGFRYFATSTDSGATFTSNNAIGLEGFCNRLLVAGTTFFAVGSGQLFKSTDGGAHWTDIDVANLYVFDAALGDATGKTVVVATQGGIHRSSDGGLSFRQVTDGYTQAIVADPRAPARIIGSQCPGFRASSDGGASFGDALGGTCAYRLIGAGPTLYAIDASSEEVLLASSDGGSSWTPADVTGIPDGSGGDVTSIAASGDGSKVYIGTAAGLFKAAH